MMKRIFILLFFALLVACGSSDNPSAPPVFDTGINPDEWALVPAGDFLMGMHKHEILVDYDYEIMVTDVTNAHYIAYLNEALEEGTITFDEEANEIVGYYPGDVFHGYNHEEEIAEGDWLHIDLNGDGLRFDFDGTIFTVKEGYENHPVTQVTWFGAQAYCEYYDGRLPGEIEWEKAARGSEDARAYPWGDEIERNQANFYSSHDLFEKIFSGIGNTTPVGFYNGQTYDYDGEEQETLDSASPYGLYGMAGNVWQWVGDVYTDQHYRYLRGGSKESYEYDLRVWTRNNAHPEYSSPSVGFRCVRDPQ
jgi:formylglycine-generating enzyme